MWLWFCSVCGVTILNELPSVNKFFSNVECFFLCDVSIWVFPPSRQHTPPTRPENLRVLWAFPQILTFIPGTRRNSLRTARSPQSPSGVEFFLRCSLPESPTMIAATTRFALNPKNASSSRPTRRCLRPADPCGYAPKSRLRQVRNPLPHKPAV